MTVPPTQAGQADPPAHAIRTDSARPRAPRAAATLTVTALGVVYGSIGTSPLYALGQLFHGRVDLALTPDVVLGGISLVIWAIIIVVAVKYAGLVLRAQNDGEGGIFALYALLHEHRRRGLSVLLWALMLGAGLLFGDGIISPSISVLAAVEGLGVASPTLAHGVVPLTVLLLTALFAVQHRGTAGIGRVFGLVLVVWFAVIAVLGLRQVLGQPGILAAFNPVHGIRFLWHEGAYRTLLLLGALILVVTGSEAMYADLGHFGPRPIRLAWFGVVFPALLLNYLGQGAYLLGGGKAADGNLFFALVPGVLIYPVVLLATVATVIAAQALISGAFTLASQAIRLGLFPRLAILHTHEEHAGQIYIPFINWSLYTGCILLVVVFGSSAALGAAYGLAVSGVMVITSLAMVPVARIYWRWSRARIGVVWGCLVAVNVAFLVACTLKVLEGGFVPLGIGIAGFVVMATWKWGRKATAAALFRAAGDDDREAGGDAPGGRCVHRAQCDPDGAEAGAACDRSRAGAAAAVAGAIRNAAAQPHFRRGDAPQGTVCARQPLQGGGVRPRARARQRDRRGAAVRVHGGAERGGAAGGACAAPRDRPAGGPEAVDRACFAREPGGGAGDGVLEAGALSPVRDAAQPLAAGLLLLRDGGPGAAFLRDRAGAGAIAAWQFRPGVLGSGRNQGNIAMHELLIRGGR